MWNLIKKKSVYNKSCQNMELLESVLFDDLNFNNGASHFNPFIFSYVELHPNYQC